jgi:hypothetical protein
MPHTETPLTDFDALHQAMFESIKDFFRFEKNHSNAIKFDDAYYAKVAEALKKRVDHEMKHLRNPYLP